MQETPMFKHASCACCTFLGAFDGCDLYFCEQGGLIPTVIARYGDDGPDYRSGLMAAKVDPHLGEALRRAINRNLIVRRNGQAY